MSNLFRYGACTKLKLGFAKFCMLSVGFSRISSSFDYRKFLLARREAAAALLKFVSGNRIEPDWSCHPCHCGRFRLRHASAAAKETSRSPSVVAFACPRIRAA